MPQQTAEATATANGSPPTDDLTGTGTLAAKLARIMGRLDRITRDGKVSGSGGYSYASADALSDVLRPALAAEGVVMIPADVEVIDQRIDEIDKGSYTQTRYTVALRVGWTLTDGETTLTMATVGTGVDYSGKAANAAHTFARVNALKSAFHVSTGEDDEAAQNAAATTSAPRQQGTGELPDLDPGAGVTGHLAIAPDGRIGISFKAADTGAFEAIKDAVKGLRDRQYDAAEKIWTVPGAEAGAAVVLARHVGLAIPDALAARFPAAPPAADGDPPAPSADTAAWDNFDAGARAQAAAARGESDDRRPSSDDDIPF